MHKSIFHSVLPKRHTRYLNLLTRFAAGVALACQLNLAQADVAPLSVQGNKILAGNQEVSLAGMSMFWSNTGWGGDKFYNKDVVAWIKRDWNASLVRAAMGADVQGGYFTDPANKQRVFNVVDAAIANDIYVIIDWHSHEAHRYPNEAIAFFEEMARKYGGRNHVIYEIYNEPLQVSWSNDIKPYAERVIGAIRAIDPDNLIIVGTPNWSQGVTDAAANPITRYRNIAYTLHFYAGTHGQWLRNNAKTALDRGIALFVTEWGSVNADGDGGVALSETNAWMEFMRVNKISHANWSLTDKREGSAALVPGASTTGGWVSSQLTASGALVKSYILNWQTGLSNVSSSSSSRSSSRSSSSISSSRSSSSRSSISSSSRSSSVSSSSRSSSRSSVSSSSRSSVSSSSRSSSFSSSRSSSAATGGSGSCAYVVSNNWGSGFVGAIRITNNGSSAINGWTVNWTYTGSTRLSGKWNATVTGSNPYSATSLSWNSTIQPGQTVEFGFQGTHSGTAEIPTVTGSVCN
jgi:endoglucanase